jgi:EAL domain-containing protein (putative c-di-GMP-specific phosphodiesterase class I)
LDDFGTGYSSLVYLDQFPIDILKIDRCFIGKLARDPTSNAIVKKIIELAHVLHMSVVSEGVESASQLDEVRSLGSDSCQGFFFSVPLASSSIESALNPPKGSKLGLTLPVP